MPVDKFGRSHEIATTQVTEGASLPYIHDNFLRTDGTGEMTGALNLGHNKITNVIDPIDQQDAATKAYVERAIELVYESPVRNFRTSDIDMDRYNIRNLPLIPSEPSDATSKYYVDSGRTKPIITIWAAERGRLNAGTMEWSFGHGEVNRHTGYTMLAPGRILRMGLTCNQQGGNNQNATVKLTVNGLHIDRCVVTQTAGHNSGVNVFNSPQHQVNQGDVLNFVTVMDNEVALSSIVSILIELDL